MPREVYYVPTTHDAIDKINLVASENVAARINELKKDLKRLSNKKAIYIAARMSGKSQDEKLHALEGKLVKIEEDIAKRKSAYQKGEILSSTSAPDGSRKGISLESLITTLELEKGSLKDKVRYYTRDSTRY